MSNHLVTDFAVHVFRASKSQKNEIFMCVRFILFMKNKKKELFFG